MNTNFIYSQLKTNDYYSSIIKNQKVQITKVNNEGRFRLEINGSIVLNCSSISEIFSKLRGLDETN